MPEDKKKQKARLARYHERLREEGMVKVCVFVPAAKSDALKRYAERLRKNAK